MKRSNCCCYFPGHNALPQKAFEESHLFEVYLWIHKVLHMLQIMQKEFESVFRVQSVPILHVRQQRHVFGCQLFGLCEQCHDTLTVRLLPEDLWVTQDVSAPSLTFRCSTTQKPSHRLRSKWLRTEVKSSGSLIPNGWTTQLSWTSAKQ